MICKWDGSKATKEHGMMMMMMMVMMDMWAMMVVHAAKEQRPGNLVGKADGGLSADDNLARWLDIENPLSVYDEDGGSGVMKPDFSWTGKGNVRRIKLDGSGRVSTCCGLLLAASNLFEKKILNHVDEAATVQRLFPCFQFLA